MAYYLLKKKKINKKWMSSAADIQKNEKLIPIGPNLANPNDQNISNIMVFNSSQIKKEKMQKKINKKQ